MVVVARIPEELLIQQRDVRALELGMRDVDSRVDDRQRDACRQGWRGVGADRCAPPLGGPQRIGETDGRRSTTRPVAFDREDRAPPNQRRNDMLRSRPRHDPDRQRLGDEACAGATQVETGCGCLPPARELHQHRRPVELLQGAQRRARDAGERASRLRRRGEAGVGDARRTSRPRPRPRPRSTVFFSSEISSEPERPT